MEKKTITYYYCLLCAQLKCVSKLIHLQADEEVFRKTIEKLSRLSILYVYDEKFPKNICESCNDNLHKAFEFVAGVEKAQHILSDLCKNQIKAENISSKEQKCDLLDNKSEKISLKEEKCDILDDKSGNISFDEQKCDIFDDKFEKKSSEENKHNILDDKSDCSVSLDFEIYSQSSDDSSIISEGSSSCESPSNNKKRKSSKNPHTKLTWNDYQWTCSICETQFATTEDLKVHSMQFHQICNPLKCHDCNVRKLHLNRFIVHIQRHKAHLKHLCYKCNSKFLYTYELNAHIRKAHGPRTNYICPGCNADFESSEELHKHTQTFYRGKRFIHIPLELQSNLSSLSCDICNRSFRTKALLFSHLLIHTDRKKDHTCEKCGKGFFNKRQLAGHFLIHDDKRPHQCIICKSSFKSMRQLKTHISIHSGEKPHTCDQCGKGFRLKRHLNSHKIIHTDSLPYECRYCDKKFRFKSIRDQHIRQHTGLKPYSCEICVRDFTNWPNYNKHMKRRHDLDMSKKKRTPEGVYPINPSTGKIIKQDTNETLEWKNQNLKGRVKRRPSSHKELQINALDGAEND